MDSVDELFSVFDDDSQSKKRKLLDDSHEQTGNKKHAEFMKIILDAEQQLDTSSHHTSCRPDVSNYINSNLDSSPACRIKVYEVQTDEECLHEVAVPADVDFIPMKSVQSAPAKEYPFLLDPFQKEAIRCLEENQSVLVSAHTSAGKTVVASYAIAMSLRAKQRVIYTTPIKALSNQKYREFMEDFGDVGLMTGDVTINATASCLIMTTEILRSMLYRGSEVTKEVGWVVFDEIHYMRDKERGVVWEETIILLPDNVHYVFLSATIPNAVQFAKWVCHLHSQACHVVYTDYRPVPLQQYIFPAGGNGLYLVVDENGDFQDENFESAMESLQLVNVNSGRGGKTYSQRGRGETNCYKIVKMIMERNFAPVIIFSFSKKECEAYATQMAKLDFNSDAEKALVEEVFNNAMDLLTEEDRKLPQVVSTLPLLKKGIGIHHSGLLPILKETIEIIFSEGLIKALFATETFSMGLNMPARTVLFTSPRKFDGKDFRWISSGEYIQMSGRAGRRGLDDRGIVILMLDEKMTPSVAKNMVKGLPDPLNSAFHLTYSMVLNLMRVDEVNPEYILEKSFFQFQNYAVLPEMYEQLKQLEAEYDSFEIPDEDNFVTFYKIKQQIIMLNDELYSFINKPQYCLKFLKPGRLVRVKKDNVDFEWGMVINVDKCANNENPNRFAAAHAVNVLLHISKKCADYNLLCDLKPPKKHKTGTMKLVSVGLNAIKEISAVRLIPPQNLASLDNRMKVLKILKETRRRLDGDLPLLDPIQDYEVKDKAELKDILHKINAFKMRLKDHPLYNNSDLAETEKLYEQKLEVENKIKNVKLSLKRAKSLIQMEELKCRKRVLRRMGFCSPGDVIEIKGRVACEISSADELLLTEMIFAGVFNNLDVHQMNALLSCFIFQEKSCDMPQLTEELSGPLQIMQTTARRIAKVIKECKMEIEPDAYVESFKPHLMDITYAWSRGANFAEICKTTDIFEGSIIRCLRRLEELLRQLYQAAKAIGNTEMENKFSEGIRCIKRDIAFAASLYL